MELGIYSFAETSEDPLTGETIGAEARMKNLMEEVELAEAVGLDVFGIGEHHRPDFMASAPAIILAAAAARTKRMRLTSTVTVLSSADPVRVFQDFSTLDLLSGGRAEIMAGRGSFIESFPLFGYALDDYDALFTEKLDLLLRIRAATTVTWSGRHRAPLDRRGVYPRPVQDPLPVWIAVGGSPPSVARAGTLGLPLAIAIIGGEPERFAPLAALYRDAGHRAGHDPEALRIGINSHGLVGDSAADAGARLYPAYAAMMTRLGRERGWPPISRPHFDQITALRGAVMIGSPEEVATKILYQHGFFGHDRYLMQMSVGAVRHEDVLRSIELFGTKVAPLVRAGLAQRTPRFT